MATQQLIHLLPFLLVLTVRLTTALEEKATDVVVEGVVYCQACNEHGTWGLDGAKPIEHATISVICRDRRNRVSYYKACETDRNGYFYAELKGFKVSHYLLDHPLHSCKVKLVSSPLKTCDLFTNINYGLYGAPLRYEDKRIEGSNYEAVIYAAGPLAFRPGNCVLNKDQEPKK